MPDKRTTPDPAEGARRRKRPAPTIDLTATDVSASSPDHEVHAAEPPPRDEHPSAEARQPAAENPAGNGAKPGNWAAARQMFFAGLGGAAIVALVSLGVWLAGLVPARYANPVDAGSASVAGLNERLTKIESSIVRIPAGHPGVSERLSAADNAVKSLGIALTALNKRSDEVTGRADAADKAITQLRDSVQGLSRNTSTSLSPADIEAANPNWVGGDIYAGACSLDQNLIFRPTPATPGHATPVEQLWHIGASTHPGPGLGAGSGYLVAKQLTRPPLVRRMLAKVPGVP